MSERKITVGKIQIIWSRSSMLLKILVIVLIVFSMAALTALTWARQNILEETEQMRSEAAALIERDQVLEDRIQSMDSVDTIQEIAEEELGMVTPDTILVRPE